VFSWERRDARRDGSRRRNRDRDVARGEKKKKKAKVTLCTPEKVVKKVERKAPDIQKNGDADAHRLKRRKGEKGESGERNGFDGD